MKMKVLTVEDNASLRMCIVDMLDNEGYQTFSAGDVNAAKKVFCDQLPDIVLLDIMLPGGNGYELIEFFRKRHDSRILMLTALDDDQSKRIAYENGADDYITKPFDINELIYKLTAIGRRLLFEQKQVEIGDIIFDPMSNLLCCKKQSFYIQPSQMKLLKQLYIKYLEETYFPKNGLSGMEGVELSEESRIQTLIARLRKNLTEIGSETVSIETLYGKGYRLNVSAPKGNGHG